MADGNPYRDSIGPVRLCINLLTVLVWDGSAQRQALLFGYGGETFNPPSDPIMTATFSVYQTQPNGTSERLYWGITEKEAQAEADRINGHLAERGIPSWVSCAYVS